MARTVYELCGADDRRFSPFCWRTRLALAHKGLDATYEPVSFTEKDKLTFSGQSLVPVLVDGETIVADSWAIACYLDEAYGDAPPLFDGPMARASAHFLNAWADRTIHPAVFKTSVLDIFNGAMPKDQDYFRSSREKRIGGPLEEFQDRGDDALSAVRNVFEPARTVLADDPFLGGPTPGYADYIVAGSLCFANLASPTLTFFPADDPIRAWYQRLEGALPSGGLPPLP
jgi:glutathione S-transferase